MDTFEKNVVDFLQHKEKKVLVIKGKWGVGKTFTWDKIVEKHGKDTTLSNYSYVSLFGLEGLNELQSRVFYNARSMSQKKGEAVVKNNLKRVGNIAKHIPQVSKFSGAISAIENSLVNDYLICIDDLERKSSKLSMSTLLGYVSNLAETSKCKIVLIFNDDTLEENDKVDIDKYREKVIDTELEFSPLAESNIDIEFKEHQCRDMICDTFKADNLNNIRIIKHIKWNLDEIIKYVDNAEEPVKQDILTTTAILTYVHHEPSIKIRANQIQSIFNYSSEKPVEDKALQSRISALGYAYYAEYEAEIINYIENGRINEEIFIESIEQLNERQKTNNISSELTAAWGSYNNNFLTSSEDVIKSLKDFLDKHISTISARELEPILETLEELEEGFDRNAYIDKFVAIKLDNCHESMIGQLKGMTVNTELLEKIKEKEVELNQHYSIYTVISKIVRERGWNIEDEEFLASHSIDEIYEFLSTDEHEDLLKTVRGAKSIFSNSDGKLPRDEFGRNLHEAILKLAKRSALDNYRVTHFFGIDTTEPEETKEE
ncbi:hypothetical protein LYZ37_05220 [Vibrio tubiashii]|uniref:P-loop NTPase fold protein n=1 Tax=Vibrio tubiashii TaxID=29498 RepID=UPI00234EB371|nr:P-loop NTPase fold protein [Vibrio tubiashii]WCP68127.1 hypothetical protein LYZ37_05220 [Vibrio tubiashii]